MIEQMGRLAEQVVTRVGFSRRRFLSKFAGLAGLAVASLVIPVSRAKADVDPACFDACMSDCGYDPDCYDNCIAAGGGGAACGHYCATIARNCGRYCLSQCSTS